MAGWLAVLVLVALLSAAGHLLFKQTAVLGLGWRAKLQQPRFLLGCVFFGVAPVLTYLAARHLDFSIIFAATALNFPFVMILARVFLGEPLDRAKVVGVCGIVLGLLLFII